MNLFRHWVRDWLNDIDSVDTGSVQTNIEFSRPSEWFDFTANLTIRDCSRQVNLAFSIFECSEQDVADAVRRRIEKLDTLQGHLDAIRNGLTEAVEDWEAYESES